MELQRWMKQWNMLPEEGGTILCAVSGGRDSICLLHYLYSIGKEYHFHVAAGHFNHLMRTTAQRDVDFVQQFCQERQIPFYMDAAPVYEYAEQHGLGVEEAGRRLRYDFLEKKAQEIGASKIATAHHLGDQAETVLLNLFRGTGPEGLAGIPPVRGKYIRPLLQTSREEIEAYLEEHGIAHVEDETNSSLDFARNRLRLVVWPELQKINPAVRENIARSAEIVRSENEYLNTLAEQYLPQNGTEIDCEVLLSAPKVLQMRIIRGLMNRLPSGKKDVGQNHFDAIAHIARNEGLVDLPGGMHAVCRNGKLQILMNSTETADVAILESETSVVWKTYNIRLCGEQETVGDDQCLQIVDTGKPITIRSWHRDDRIRLPGSRGERSLKRVFTDYGIKPEQRDQIPIVCVEGEIAAVWGIGTSDIFDPKDQQKYKKIVFKKC